MGFSNLTKIFKTHSRIDFDGIDNTGKQPSLLSSHIQSPMLRIFRKSEAVLLEDYIHLLNKQTLWAYKQNANRVFSWLQTCISQVQKHKSFSSSSRTSWAQDLNFAIKNWLLLSAPPSLYYLLLSSSTLPWARYSRPLWHAAIKKLPQASAGRRSILWSQQLGGWGGKSSKFQALPQNPKPNHKAKCTYY